MSALPSTFEAFEAMLAHGLGFTVDRWQKLRLREVQNGPFAQRRPRSDRSAPIPSADAGTATRVTVTGHRVTSYAGILDRATPQTRVVIATARTTRRRYV